MGPREVHAVPAGVPGAFTANRGPRAAGHWVVDDAGHRRVLMAEGDPDGKDRKANDDIVGAVQGIDEPRPGALAVDFPDLLGDDAVPGELRLDNLDDRLLRGEVQVGDHVPG